MCHFYQDRAELLSAVAPFIAAGLRRGERCVWVPADPLDPARPVEELRSASRDAAAALAQGSLLVRDHRDWYVKGQGIDAAAVCALWLDEEEKALAEGYEGLRAVGNPSFVSPADWDAFVEYERAADEAFRGRRIVALCSYWRRQCRASEVLDVVHNHGCVLERGGKGWQAVTPGLA